MKKLLVCFAQKLKLPNKDKVAKSRERSSFIWKENIYIYFYIYNISICTWGQRRKDFSKPRIEGEKTLETYKQANELSVNCGYTQSQKKEKWSLGKKSFIRNTDVGGE